MIQQPLCNGPTASCPSPCPLPVAACFVGCPPGAGGGAGRGVVGTRPMGSVCLPLAAPIGLSPLLIPTLCGSERVLVVSTEGGGVGPCGPWEFSGSVLGGRPPPPHPVRQPAHVTPLAVTRAFPSRGRAPPGSPTRPLRRRAD